MSTSLSAAALVAVAASVAAPVQVQLAPAPGSSTQPGSMARPDEAAQGLIAQTTVIARTTAARKAAVYAVRPGDTLSLISRDHCGTPRDYPSLAAASRISDPDLIFPGQPVTLACHAAVTRAVAAASISGDSLIDKERSAQHRPAAHVPPAAPAVPSGSPRHIAQVMASSRYGWGSAQFSCLDSLWVRESGWRWSAENPGSGAYGIPQALPGSKMASAGSDWRTNPATQIRWGLGYIHDTYGTPCGAWGHEESSGWY